eukprot:CAMPEP_0198561246 /NCGR_PEP_ID=MMETSP1462-20131121/95159_1 /TAXON_ID=1333877 /ORGANISM="Brandtodinium nutriculum, Strain RCC3387" /LENGTH=41 /DNA_ID= /DNA_START= /DNA_END= /DNA_ORIENTATION=
MGAPIPGFRVPCALLGILPGVLLGDLLLLADVRVGSLWLGA